MKRAQERTILGLGIAVVALALTGLALVQPWWTFEESTGRPSAAEGPDGDAESRHAEITFYPGGWDGNRDPDAPEAARTAVRTIEGSMVVALAAVLLYGVGQSPVTGRFFNRRASIGLAAVATVALVTGLAAAWLWLPPSMAGSGVEGPFSSALLQHGYIRTRLDTGWLAALLATVATTSCLLASYSAGDADASVVNAYQVVEP